MIKLIIIVQPFVLKQTIQVFEDNKNIETIKCELNNLVSNCKSLYDKYLYKEIILKGNEQFNSKIEEELNNTFKSIQASVNIIY